MAHSWFRTDVFCLIGVSVYGAKGDNRGSLEYSYILTVFSLFLSTPGVFMVAVARSAVASNASVSPQPQQQQQQPAEVPPTTITTLTSSQTPYGLNGSYPYGRGQHNVDTPNTGDGYGGGGDVGGTYYYGGGGDASFAYGCVGGSDVSAPYGVARGGGPPEAPQPQPGPPHDLQQHLPYAMHPDSPEQLPVLHPVPMPEPGPIGGGGGGGGGYGLTAGQSRTPSRLPPISNVAPTAPPPPSEGEQPPSYMEAIGHNFTR